MPLALTGCGLLRDNCDALCSDVADRIDACRGDVPWSDFGASRRANWISQCQNEWEATSGGLGARDLELALEICDDGQATIGDLPCEDVIALYGSGD